MPTASLVVAVPMLSILALATTTDLLDRRIPNGLSLGGAAVGLLVSAVAFGPGALGLALLGWSVCLACFIPLYFSGAMAGGDVKLMAMVGAFLGPVNGFVACLCTLIAGGALASLSLAWRQLARRIGAGPRLAIAHTDQPVPAQHALDKIPYAAAIAIGAAVAALPPVWLTDVLPGALQ